MSHSDISSDCTPWQYDLHQVSWSEQIQPTVKGQSGRQTDMIKKLKNLDSKTVDSKYT